MDLKEAELLGNDVIGHWYYATKSRALVDFLDHRRVGEVLDVGAGTGVFSRALIDAGICQDAVCVDIGYDRERTENYSGGSIKYTKGVERVSQALVLMMDVLEHVDDDVTFLRSYTDHMPANSLLLVTVPAFQWLWSGHDEFLGHRRRYTRGQLKEVLEEAGLRVLKHRYMYVTLLPIVAVLRQFNRWLIGRGAKPPRSQLTTHSALVNTVLTGIHDAERRLVFPHNRFAGLSLFAAARKS